MELDCYGEDDTLDDAIAGHRSTKNLGNHVGLPEDFFTLPVGFRSGVGSEHFMGNGRSYVQAIQQAINVASNRVATDVGVLL